MVSFRGPVAVEEELFVLLNHSCLSDGCQGRKGTTGGFKSHERLQLM